MNTEQYKITKNNCHDYEYIYDLLLIDDRAIYDLLLIDDNTFLSCSRDKTIKVWKY